MVSVTHIELDVLLQSFHRLGGLFNLLLELREVLVHVLLLKAHTVKQYGLIMFQLFCRAAFLLG